MVAIRAVWDGFVWFWDHIVYVLAGIGTASVIVRAADALAKKQILAHPNSAFWRYVGRSLVYGGTFLAFVMDLVSKIALNRQDPSPVVEAQVVAQVVDDNQR